MGWPNRFEIKDGFYHVMNRGAAHRHIFVSDYLKTLFVHCLELTVQKYNIRVHAFCVMGNHYHLLIQLKEKNLSSAMQYLSMTYTKAYNKYRKKDGPIFKSRFKSIWIETNRYLSNVCRYIHLNPVAAFLVDTPEDYYWSSFQDYVLTKPRYKWVETSLFKNAEEIRAYCSMGVDSRTKAMYEKLKLPSKI